MQLIVSRVVSTLAISRFFSGRIKDNNLLYTTIIINKRYNTNEINIIIQIATIRWESNISSNKQEKITANLN